MQHAARESASDSFSLPPWTSIGRGVRRTGAHHPTLKYCTWCRDEVTQDMYA